MKNCLLLSLFLIQSSLAYTANNYDYIYRNNPTGLYNAQSEQAFLANKQQAYGQTVLSALPVFALLGGSYATYRFFSGALKSGEKDFFGSTRFFFLTFISTTLSSIFTSILTPYAGAIQEPISGFFNSCWGYVFGPPNDDLQKLELQYIRTKANLTEKNQKALESNFAKLRQRFSPQSFHASSQNKEELELTLVKRILQLPIESKILGFNQTLFETEFSGYRGMTSTEPIFELERFARSLVIASKHKNPKLKSALYLLGPPGVGKTEAVFKLGKVLDIPVIKINLAEIASIGQLKGIKCEFPEDNRCTPGQILSNIVGIHKNRLLFFDEADQTLNRLKEGQSHELVSFMLDLLEGKTQFVDNPYLGADIDIRHFGIILAGNQQLINKALQSRLSYSSFGNYTQAYRIKAGRDRFLPEILQDYSDTLTLEDFSLEDLEKIDAMAINEDPGFREQIRMIERFVHQKTQNSPSATSSAN